jgi:hypothetical protein
VKGLAVGGLMVVVLVLTPVDVKSGDFKSAYVNSGGARSITVIAVVA